MRKEHTPKDRSIFVFGSNQQGRHGAGAALYARQRLGAMAGRGEGLMHRCYALPTCSLPGVALPLYEVKEAVDRFLAFAKAHPELQFYVSAIGCGLAGYDAADIAPLFIGSPDNCSLPDGW